MVERTNKNLNAYFSGGSYYVKNSKKSTMEKQKKNFFHILDLKICWKVTL